MKASYALTIGAYAIALASADGVTPVGKCVELLSNLEAQIVKEGEEAAKLNSEKGAWCKDTTTNLGFEIETGTSDVAKLGADIDKEAATIGSLSAKIEELVASAATAEKDLKAATKIRAEEGSDFSAEEKELTEIVSQLQRAIGILERELSKSGGAALVQVQSAGSVIQALEALVTASVFSSADASRLAAFVQSSQRSDDSSGDAGAPDAAVYASKSGGIVEVLEDLLDKAQSQLSEARKAEEKSLNEFELLKQSLQDEMKFSAKSLDEAKAASAASSEAKSAAEGALATTSKDLAGDKATLADVEKDCASYADDYAAEAKSRAEELEVIKKTKAVLVESTGGASLVSYSADQVPPSFLQIGRSHSAISSGADLANSEAVHFVRELARKTHSPALAQLAKRMASAMRVSAASGEDPFAKVKGLISDIIAKLEKEGEADASQKAYCDEEMGEAAAKKKEKTGVIEKLSTKIDQMTSRSAQLKSSTAVLQEELADLAATQKEMDKLRKEENAFFNTQKKELTAGISGVEIALKTLREYYAQDKDHEAKDGAASGIIGLLEVVQSDFTKSLAEITATEDSAQSEYEQTTQDNEVEKAAKDKDLEYKTKEAADLDKAVVESTADRSSMQAELDAVLEYLAKLEDMCVAKPETYAERDERRAAEIAGLKQALTILDGEAMLIQRRALGGGH